MADQKDTYTLEALLTGNNSRLKKVVDQAVMMLERLENRKSDDVQIDGDVKPLQKKVEMARRLSESLDGKNAEIDIDADTSKLSSKVKQAEMASDLLDKKKAQIEIIARNSEAIRSLQRVRLSAKQLSSEKPKVAIDVEEAAAVSRIARFKAGLKSIPNKVRVRIDADPSAVDRLTQRAGLFQKAFRSASNSVKDGFGETASEISMMQNALMALAPAAIPIVASLVPAIMAVGNAIAVVGGGAIGLAGAFGIAGAGALAFGGMAMSAYQMLQAGTLQATAETAAFQTALSSLKTEWAGLVQSNQASIFTAMANGINIAKAALTSLTPFISQTASSIAAAAGKMFSWVTNSTTAQNAFKMLNTTGVQVFNDILAAVGRFGAGFVSLITQFGPLFQFVSSGLAQMGADFQAWSNKVSTAQGIQSFISYVQTNLPVIGSIFGNVFTGIFNLFTAFGTNSQTIFGALEQMSAKFAAWSATIAQSQGFKQFIDYVQTQGPIVMSTIGDIANAVIAFATAMAPVGAAVLGVVSSIAQWVAGFAQAHPQIIMVVGAIATFIGAIGMVLPVVMNVVKGIMTVVRVFNLIRTGIQLVAGAFALFTSPIGIAVVAIGLLVAAFVLAYTKIEWFRNAINTFVQGWMAGVQMIIAGVQQFAAGWMAGWQMIVDFFSNAWNNLVMIVQGVWLMITTAVSTGIQTVTTVLSGLGAFLSGVFSAAWNGLVIIVSTVWTMISNAVQTGIQFIVSGLTAFGSMIASIFSAAWNGLVTIVTTVWSAVSSAISSAVSTITSIVSSGFSAVMSTVSSIMSSISSFISSTWSAISSAVSSAISAVVSFISSGFSNMLSVATSIMSSILSAITSAWSSITSAISSAISTVVSVLTSGFSTMISAVTSFASSLISSITSAMSSFISAVTSGASSALSALTSGLSAMVSAAAGFVGDMMSAGHNLIMGMVNGITGAAGRLVSAAVGAVKGAISAAKGALGIHSPSRVFKKIGGFTVAGMVIGLIKNTPKVAKASTKMAKAAIKGVGNMKSTSYKKAREGSKAFHSALSAGSKNAVDKMKTNYEKISKIQQRLRGKLRNSTRAKLMQQMYSLKKENAAYRAQKNVADRLNKSLYKGTSALGAIAMKREAIAKQLKKAQEKLKDVYKERANFRDSIHDNITGFGSISNSKVSTSQGLVADLKARAKAAQEYMRNINALKKKGVNKQIIADLLNAGVEGGAAQAKILAKASKSTINQVNGLQKQIGAIAGSLSRRQSEEYYRFGINTAKGLVKGLESQDKALVAAANRIANTITSTVKKNLGIHSPSRVFAGLGGHTVGGYIVGVLDKQRAAVRVMSGLATKVSDAFTPRFTGVPTIADNVRKATSNVATQVNADVVNTVRNEPVGVTLNANFALGNRDYNAFVGDITDRQNTDVRLEEVYDV